MRIGRIAAIVVALAAGVAAASKAVPDPLKTRVGWRVTPGHLTPPKEALGRKHQAFIKHLGNTHTIEAIRFAGTTPQIQALAINDLEIAAQSPAAAALAIANAKLDIRMVADVVQDGHEGYFSEYFVVRADGPIKTIEDVKGKRVA